MNKYYKKDDPTKVVSIVDDSQDAFYELSNGQMIKKDVFLKYYALMENAPIKESHKPTIKGSDFVDPESFFNKSNIVNENDILKIKNADPSKGAIDGADRTEVIINTANQTRDAKPIINESARPVVRSMEDDNSIVREVDPTKIPIPNNTNTDVSQYKVYDDEDAAYEELLNKNKPTEQIQNNPPSKIEQPPLSEIDQLFEDEKLAFGLDEAIRRKNLRLKRTEQSMEKNPPMYAQVQIDPSEMMFKTFKRNHEIKINVEFTEKIAKPEFIRLMMENMEGDIISFYKKLIIQDIMNNFKIIEDEVEKQLKEHIILEDDSDNKEPDKPKTTSTRKTTISKKTTSTKNESKDNK